MGWCALIEHWDVDADYRSVTPYLAAYAKLRRSSWNNLVCPDLAVLNICACRWRRGCQGGQATVVVSHAKPTNWLRVHLGDSDCNGSRTVLVYRCRGGASRYVSRVNHTHAAQHTAQCNGLCDEHQHPRYYGNTTAGCIPHWCVERRYRRFCRNCFWRYDSLRDKRLAIRSQQAVAISVAFSKKKPFFCFFESSQQHSYLIFLAAAVRNAIHDSPYFFTPQYESATPPHIARSPSFSTQ